MRDDRSYRPNRWTWIIAACFAALLAAIAGMQIPINRYNQAQQIAWLTAANQQQALSTATQSVVQHYIETNMTRPNTPTLEQFCKDRNGGRPLGNDKIWRDPVTGGKVIIISNGDGSFFATLDNNFPPLATARYSYALSHLQDVLARVFFFFWFVLCAMAIADLVKGSRGERIVLGQWMLYLSFSIMFLGFLGTPAEKFRQWGVGFLVISGLYLAGAIMFGRKDDPTPRCAKCRYNLTGNTSGICPECGTPLDTSIGRSDRLRGEGHSTL